MNLEARPDNSASSDSRPCSADVRHTRRQDISDKRRMVQASLLGRHSHHTPSGHRLHVSVRDGAFLARGRCEGRQFGETLGRDATKAEMRLHEILADLEAGTYRPPSHPSRKNRRPKRIPRVTLREIVEEYVADVRKRKGCPTATRYRNWLAHALEYAERLNVRKGYPLASNFDRDFVIGLRQFLETKSVTRNGRVGGTKRLMSARSVMEVLERAKAALAYAMRPAIGLLPTDFDMPFERELIGRAPRKNPIRPIVLNLETRIQLLTVMDSYELIHVGPLFILPLRPGELVSLLIDETDWVRDVLRVGDRFDGRDFTKGRQDFQIPFPEQLRPLFRAAVGDRRDGPVFRSRACFEGRSCQRLRVLERGDLARTVERELQKNALGTLQDAKKLCREIIHRAGGVSTRQLARTFQKVLRKAGLDDRDIRLYDLRHAVASEYEQADVPFVVRKYVMGHSINDVITEYTALTMDHIRDSLRRHWDHAGGLLIAIGRRTEQLKIHAADPQSEPQHIEMLDGEEHMRALRAPQCRAG